MRLLRNTVLRLVLAISLTYVVMPAIPAFAITTVNDSTEDHDNAGTPSLDPLTGQVHVSESARGPVIQFPAGSTGTFNAGSSSTVYSTDICTTNTAVSGIPCNSVLTNYETTAGLTSTLTNYVLTSTMTDYVTTQGLTSTLTNYETTAGLTSTLTNYATTQSVTSTLTNYTPKTSQAHTLGCTATYHTGTGTGTATDTVTGTSWYVGGDPTITCTQTSYTLPVAGSGTGTGTNTFTLGGVKVGAGINEAPDGTMSVSPSSVGAVPQSNFSVTMPTTLGNSVTFATITGNYAPTLRIELSSGPEGPLGSRIYDVSGVYSGASGVWQTLQPSTTGTYSYFNVVVDIYQVPSSWTYYLRLRLVGSGLALPFYISVEDTGYVSGTIIAASTALCTSGTPCTDTPTTVFAGTLGGVIDPNGNRVSFAAPASVTPYQLTLPGAAASGANYYPCSTGANGTLQWCAPVLSELIAGTGIGYGTTGTVTTTETLTNTAATGTNTSTGSGTATAALTAQSTATTSSTKTITGSSIGNGFSIPVTLTGTTSGTQTQSGTGTATQDWIEYATPTTTSVATTTGTLTTTNTVIGTATVTVTATASSTFTVGQTGTVSGTVTASGTLTQTATVTSAATITVTNTATYTLGGTGTMSGTWTSSQLHTGTMVQTVTLQGTSTSSITLTGSSTITETGRATNSATTTATNTVTESATGSATGTITYTNTSTGTATSCSGPTCTIENTQTPSINSWLAQVSGQSASTSGLSLGVAESYTFVTPSTGTNYAQVSVMGEVLVSGSTTCSVGVSLDVNTGGQTQSPYTGILPFTVCNGITPGYFTNGSWFSMTVSTGLLTAGPHTLYVLIGGNGGGATGCQLVSSNMTIMGIPSGTPDTIPYCPPG